MRGISKNALIFATIAAFLLAILPVGLVSAATTTLTAPDITTTEATVSVDITVEDVTAMWGYDIVLKFDTSLLAATGYSSHAPFIVEWPGEINNEAGYVAASYSMMFGEPDGFETTDPEPILTVDFDIVGTGASQLAMASTELSDIYGNPMGHVAVDGSVRNVAGCPLADFYWTPETPIQREAVTFTSTSTDPDGYIVSWEWDFGDHHTGTGDTAAHSYVKPGIYTVGLTVEDDEGNVDSFFDVVEVLPTPPEAEGAICISATSTMHLLDFSQCGEKKQVLKAWVKNLNDLDKTLVRVSFWIYGPGMDPLGALEPDWVWMGPNSKDLFTADLYYTDWSFAGPEMEYLVVVKVYYMDFMLPTGPHWTIVPDAPEKTISFRVIEQGPVVVYTWTDIGGYTVQFDATGTYDPDEKWGDYITSYEWRIYVGYPYQLRFGLTATYTFDEAGEYYCRLYVSDSLGATVRIDFDVTVA